MNPYVEAMRVGEGRTVLKVRRATALVTRGGGMSVGVECM